MKFEVTTPGVSEHFVQMDCPRCDIKFFVPRSSYCWYRRFKNETLYCPIGHGFVAGSPDKDFEFAEADHVVLTIKPTPVVVREVVKEYVPTPRQVSSVLRKKTAQCPVCEKWYRNKGTLKVHKCTGKPAEASTP